MTEKPKVTVLYDGTCPMCNAFIDTIKHHDRNTPYAYVNIYGKENLSRYGDLALDSEIHLIQGDTVLAKNASAIINMIASLPLLGWIRSIQTLPGSTPLLEFGYHLVAKNRYHLSSRVFWIKAVITIGFFSSVLISWKLWTTDRIYALTPVVPWNLPEPIALALAITLLGLLVGTALARRTSRTWLILTSSVVVLLWLFDQSRAQPWVWHYTLTLLALAFVPWRTIKESAQVQEQILNALRLSVIAMYFYSGLQKMNFAFVGEVFPWMASPILEHVPGITFEYTLLIGLLVPLLEIGIAACLLIPRLRPLGIAGAAVMLLYVLWTLGPFGHSWNPVVWPWNVVLFTLVLLLFWNNRVSAIKQILIPRSMIHVVICIGFCVLPLFSFFDRADSYLSFALYSGNVARAQLEFSDKTYSALPAELQIHTTPTEDRYTISLLQWSFHELQVPPYPEERVFRSVGRDICARTETNDVTLVLYGKQHRELDTKPTRLSCDQM